jgi:hypothetical protein
MINLINTLDVVRGGSQPPAFPRIHAAPDSPADPPMATQKGRTLMNKTICKLSLALGLALCLGGCGTSANLAGLGVSVDVAQKGVAAGLTVSAGTNAITVGGSYSQGTNSVAASTTIPTK